MGTIDATAREVNIWATLNAYASGWQLAEGPKIVLLGENGFVPQRNQPFVRLTLDHVSARHSGRFSSSQSAERIDKLLTVDVFDTDGTETQPTNGYRVARIADDVAHALRRLNLAFTDYSDPQSPATVTGVRIRALDPPDCTPLPSSDGWARYRVQVPITWHLRHTIS